MKKSIFLVLIFSIVFTLSFSRVIVFIYHRFDDPRYPTTSTSSTELTMQINLVKSMGFKILAMKEFEKIVYSKEEYKDNAVLFTVDDGYITTYTHAYPIFKKYNVPFTVFLYFRLLGHSKEYLTWDMIKEMKEDGVEFGDHSYLHDKFPNTEERIGKTKFIEYFKEDTEKTLKIWSKHFSDRLKYYAYPYGYYNEDMIKVLKSEGFKLAFTQMPGQFIKGISPFEIPREPLLQDWATKTHTKYILSRFPLLTDGKPYYWKDGKFYVNAKIKYPKTITKAIVYIREKGIVKSKLIGDIVKAGPFNLKNRYNSLMLSIRDKNHHEHVLYFLIIKGGGR